MSTIKSSDEHLTLNADGTSKDIKFQANGVEKASISSSGAFTSTTIDATKLTGTIPNFTSTGIDDNADATAITISSAEQVGIGATSPDAPLVISGGTAMTGGWGRTLALEHNFPVLAFRSENSTDAWAGIGYDNSTGMKFFVNSSNNDIPNNGTLGLTILDDGIVTMPSQPAFQATATANQNNIATGSEVTVVWGGEIFDVSSNFASNTFTAPVTGKYFLTANLRVNNIDSAANWYSLRIRTSNRSYLNIQDPDTGADRTDLDFGLSILADMDAGDTADVAFVQEGGTAQSDIDGDGKYTNFTGFLAC